jgi:hypothetical protein
MNFSDFDSVISQEVMPNELKIIGFSEESEHLSIVVEELFLRWHSSSSKLLL